MYLDDENVYAPLVIVSFGAGKYGQYFYSPIRKKRLKIFTKVSLQYILHLLNIPVNPYITFKIALHHIMSAHSFLCRLGYTVSYFM